MFEQPMKDNIFLVGFSGTGKSSVGQELARSLGYAYVDSDTLIEARVGMGVPAYFAQEGEAAFRAVERAVLWEVCHSDLQVVATGGGVVLDADNRMHMITSGYVVALEARNETIYTRLLLDTARGDAGGRPLLAGEGGLFARIVALRSVRAPFYADADWTVHTDFLTPAEVAAEIERALPLIRRRVEGVRGGPGSPTSADAPRSRAGERRVSVATVLRETGIRMPPPTFVPPVSDTLTVAAATGTYDVIIAPGTLARLGQEIAARAGDGPLPRIFVVADEALTRTPHVERALAALAAGGAAPVLLTVPGSEGSKSLRMAEMLYMRLAVARAERRDVVVALGGGVTGDLGGFVAATYLRGLRLVQVPTTLLAMVDSSIGGKTGVNLGATKNLVGAFYPPMLVLADTDVLATLPPRSFFEGFGEVVKQAVIPGAPRAGESDDALAMRAADRFGRLEQAVRAAPVTGDTAAWLAAWDAADFAAVVRESAAVKVGVVAEDERETGLRLTLNFGHTLGHALESAFNVAAGATSGLLHGEAVALGMMAVTEIALRRGLCDHAFADRLRGLLRALRLPTTLADLPGLADVDRVAVRAQIGTALQLDKKSAAGKVRWILPRGIGRVVVVADVQPAEIAAALDALGL